MDIEIYRKLQKEDLTPSLLSEDNQESDLRIQLGFKEQLRFEEYLRKRKKAALFYDEISEGDYSIWQGHLPRKYFDHVSYYDMAARPDITWAGYVLDKIPNKVLLEIGHARSLSVFDYLLIRTPEPSLIQDRAIFGVIFQGHPGNFEVYETPCARYEHMCQFLIARWGKSLRPFCDIRNETNRPPRTIFSRLIKIREAISGHMAFRLNETLRNITN